MYLRMGTTTEIVMNIKSAETLTSPHYLFRFVQRTTNEEITFVRLSTQETSTYPERYRRFPLDVDQLFCGQIGEYYFYIYEQESPSNIDYTQSGKLLTFGVAALIDSETTTNVTHYTTHNIFLTRQ